MPDERDPCDFLIPWWTHAALWLIVVAVWVGLFFAGRFAYRLVRDGLAMFD